MSRTCCIYFINAIFFHINPVLSFKSYFCFWIIEIVLKILSVFLCIKSN